MAETIKSGWFPTPSGTTVTPTGAPKAIAVDNPYLTKDEFIMNEIAIGLGINENSPIYTSGRLDYAILSASAEINRMCRRWFDTQTIDETYLNITVRPNNPQLVTVALQNAPYQQINSIYFQVLKWFIQIDINNSSGYLQDFPDLGFYKIVPLLSNSGTGIGSPLPAEIVDKVPLGILWTNYTFGYGQLLSKVVLTSSDKHTYQAPLFNRLIAPTQSLTIFKNGTALALNTDYTVTSFPNGIILLKADTVPSDVITATYTSNESVPADIKQATALLVADMVGQGLFNPMGAGSMTIQTWSVSWKDKPMTRTRLESILKKYEFNTPIII